MEQLRHRHALELALAQPGEDQRHCRRARGAVAAGYVVPVVQEDDVAGPDPAQHAENWRRTKPLAGDNAICH